MYVTKYSMLRNIDRVVVEGGRQMSGMGILVPLTIPSIGALLLTNKKIISEKRRNLFVGAVVFINILAFILLMVSGAGRQFHILKVNDFLDIFIKIDQLGILFGGLASLLWVFTSFYAMEYMKHEGKERSFFIFFLLTLSVTLGISFSGNLFTLYIFYELLTLATFPLVIHAGTEEALASGRKYMIYSFSGATFVLLGMILLYSVTHDLSFFPKGLFTAVSNYDSTVILVSYLSMFVGFGVKAALVPFHSWLPGAMVAPTPVSALLHAVAVVKSGIFALIRMTFFVFGATVVREIQADRYMIVMILLTIILGSMLALHQSHLKKRLAYSTISQLGYILLGIIMLNEEALLGGLLHMINHALIKITLFFCVGAIYYQTHKIDISEIKGLGKKMPITFLCFTISAISLVGIPPTNGFVSKWFLGLGALHNHNFFFAVILLLSAFLTAGYLLPVSIQGFFTKVEEQDIENLDPPLKMLVPIVVLTGCSVVLGLFPNVLINFINEIVFSVF